MKVKLAVLTGAVFVLSVIFSPYISAKSKEDVPVLSAEKERTCRCGEFIAQNDTGKNDAEENQEEEEIKPLPPEKYYQLALERQEIIISSYKHILKILDFHSKRPTAAHKDLLKHEKEKQQKLDALFEKYGTGPRAYYRSWRGTDELEKRSRYLDNHPELRDKLAENSSRIRKLEKKVWEKLRPIYRDAH